MRKRVLAAIAVSVFAMVPGGLALAVSGAAHVIDNGEFKYYLVRAGNGRRSCVVHVFKNNKYLGHSTYKENCDQVQNRYRPQPQLPPPSPKPPEYTTISLEGDIYCRTTTHYVHVFQQTSNHLRWTHSSQTTDKPGYCPGHTTPQKVYTFETAFQDTGSYLAFLNVGLSTADKYSIFILGKVAQILNKINVNNYTFRVAFDTQNVNYDKTFCVYKNGTILNGKCASQIDHLYSDEDLYNADNLRKYDKDIYSVFPEPLQGRITIPPYPPSEVPSVTSDSFVGSNHNGLSKGLEYTYQPTSNFRNETISLEGDIYCLFLREYIVTKTLIHSTGSSRHSSKHWYKIEDRPGYCPGDTKPKHVYTFDIIARFFGPMYDPFLGLKSLQSSTFQKFVNYIIPKTVQFLKEANIDRRTFGIFYLKRGDKSFEAVLSQTFCIHNNGTVLNGRCSGDTTPLSLFETNHTFLPDKFPFRSYIRALRSESLLSTPVPTSVPTPPPTSAPASTSAPALTPAPVSTPAKSSPSQPARVSPSPPVLLTPKR